MSPRTRRVGADISGIPIRKERWKVKGSLDWFRLVRKERWKVKGWQERKEGGKERQGKTRYGKVRYGTEGKVR